MDGLPGFNEDGVLPPGEYALTLDQIERSMLVTGEGVASQGGTWDRGGVHRWFVRGRQGPPQRHRWVLRVRSHAAGDG